jgi:hypothetical protein
MIKCNAVISKSEQSPEDGRAGAKHVAIDVVLMSF